MSCIIPPSENLGGIYLGSIYAACDLNLLVNSNCRAVLTVAEGTNLNYDQNYILHKEILVHDQENFDLIPYLDQCFEFIEYAR